MTLDVKYKMYSIYTIMLGTSGVGKSTLCVQISNKFKNENPYTRTNIYKLQPTVGMEFFSFNISYLKLDIKVNIWDTAGEKRFEKITESFYNNVAVVYLVYNCARQSSLNWVKKKYMDIRHRKVTCMMIGNIFGIEAPSVQKDALVFATKNNLPIFRVSAINGFNIEYPFIQLAKLVLDTYAAASNDVLTNQHGIIEINKNNDSSSSVEHVNAVDELLNTHGCGQEKVECKKNKCACKCILL